MFWSDSDTVIESDPNPVIIMISDQVFKIFSDPDLVFKILDESGSSLNIKV